MGKKLKWATIIRIMNYDNNKNNLREFLSFIYKYFKILFFF